MQKKATDLSLKMLGNVGAVERKKGKRYGQLLQEERGKWKQGGRRGRHY